MHFLDSKKKESIVKNLKRVYVIKFITWTSHKKMKFIKRIQVGDKKADLRRLPKEEKVVILGGSGEGGCCYDVIAELWQIIVGSNAPSASQIKEGFTNYMNKEVAAGNEECRMNDGDPTLAQLGYLRYWMDSQSVFDVGSIVSGGSNGSLNFGIIAGNEGSWHAVIIDGTQSSDDYYYVRDSSNGQSYTISKSSLRFSMSVSEEFDYQE